MSHTPHHSDTADRALELLASGISQTQCAKALGVSDSLISQLLSEEEFSQKLADRRYSAVKKHNTQDEAVDDIEIQLTKQLRASIGTVYDPEKLTRMLRNVNSLKRRGVTNPATDGIQQTTIVQLSLPVALHTRFALNSNNQVIAAGGQDLVTLQSNRVAHLVATKLPSLLEDPQNARLTNDDSKLQSTRRNSSVQESNPLYTIEDEFGFTEEQRRSG